MKLNKIHKSLISGLPSLQDLISATQLFQIGKRSVIYPASGGYLIISPVKGRQPRLDANQYQKLIQQTLGQDDIDILIDGLREMGFEISAKSDGQQYGRPSDHKFESEVARTGSQIPRPGNQEIGGISGLSSGGLGATKRYKTGTPDHVEIEVEYNPKEVKYKPKDALKDTDTSFVYHTHPKMTNNNYFP